ncbi:META domain-containing protein [Helicobacter monodelphidis]|uniref:META domain-containing protein n=1 Tax=Helicobacter sp. 15-1451 TaxID=2004995 RepID=UPI0015ECC0C4|nr:META domain-containing protein [Helicobacter sp. 15-1451]
MQRVSALNGVKIGVATLLAAGLLVACGGAKEEAVTAPVQEEVVVSPLEGKWVVKEVYQLDKKKKKPTLSKVNLKNVKSEMYLEFSSAEGQVGAATGCNTLGANFTYENEKLTLGHPALTQKSCGKAVMNVEKIMTDGLVNELNVAIAEEKTLTLDNPNFKLVLEKVAVAEEVAPAEPAKK